MLSPYPLLGPLLTPWFSRALMLYCRKWNPSVLPDTLPTKLLRPVFSTMELLNPNFNQFPVRLMMASVLDFLDLCLAFNTVDRVIMANTQRAEVFLYSLCLQIRFLSKIALWSGGLQQRSVLGYLGSFFNSIKSLEQQKLTAIFRGTFPSWDPLSQRWSLR